MVLRDVIGYEFVLVRIKSKVVLGGSEMAIGQRSRNETAQLYFLDFQWCPQGSLALLLVIASLRLVLLQIVLENPGTVDI